MKRILTLVTAALLLLGTLPFSGLPGGAADAKTVISAKGENVFFYATDRDGKSVLLDILPLDAVKEIAHGQENGDDYYYSSTDNYPTTQYCEAKGVTIPELVGLAAERSAVPGAKDIAFDSGDSLSLMATDSYGNYTRSWTYDDLYGQSRYYFEGLYDAENGWKTGWEVAGTDSSKFGVSLEEYNEKYKDGDPYYANKQKVWEGGVEMPVLLATESFSGRTTTETLVASTEAGIAAQIAANGGKTAGSLKSMLTDDTALRLCLPMTEADLMAAHRTAYDNFKWIYNIRLNRAGSALQSQGTVAEPRAVFSQSGDTLTITLSCDTPDARIYYSFDGAPQQLYTEPFTYNTGGADLTQNPVTLYITAVKPGFDDAGVCTVKYPQSGVVFESLYSAAAGQEIVFRAESGVTDEEWNAWTSAILGISVKKPSGTAYEALSASDYRVDNQAKTLTFAAGVAGEPGAYSFMIYAKGFSSKRLSVSLKKTAPELKDVRSAFGKDVTVPVADPDYSKNVYLYISSENGEKQLISTGYVDRAAEGAVTIRADWFAQASCPVKEAGEYTLELMNNSYSPASQTIRLTLTEGKVFDDVRPEDWFADAVEWAVEHELFNGVSDTAFAPNGNMTRAMFATVLWRYCGSPDGGDAGAGQETANTGSGAPAQTPSIPFTDVAADTWYTDAVRWASEEGYVTGYGNGLFGVNDPVTREQIATIFYRYTKNDPDLASFASKSGSLGEFRDAAAVSDWAADAMKWAVGIDMIHGMGDGRLEPKGLATRAQVATMFMNYAGQVSPDSAG